MGQRAGPTGPEECHGGRQRGAGELDEQQFWQFRRQGDEEAVSHLPKIQHFAWKRRRSLTQSRFFKTNPTSLSAACFPQGGPAKCSVRCKFHCVAEASPPLPAWYLGFGACLG